MLLCQVHIHSHTSALCCLTWLPTHHVLRLSMLIHRPGFSRTVAMRCGCGLVQGVYQCPGCSSGQRSIGADMYAPADWQLAGKRTAREAFLTGSGHLNMALIETIYQKVADPREHKMDVRLYEAPRDAHLQINERDKVASCCCCTCCSGCASVAAASLPSPYRVCLPRGSL